MKELDLALTHPLYLVIRVLAYIVHGLVNSLQANPANVALFLWFDLQIPRPPKIFGSVRTSYAT